MIFTLVQGINPTIEGYISNAQAFPWATKKSRKIVSSITIIEQRIEINLNDFLGQGEVINHFSQRKEQISYIYFILFYFLTEITPIVGITAGRMHIKKKKKSHYHFRNLPRVTKSSTILKRSPYSSEILRWCFFQHVRSLMTTLKVKVTMFLGRREVYLFPYNKYRHSSIHPTPEMRKLI